MVAIKTFIFNGFINIQILNSHFPKIIMGTEIPIINFSQIKEIMSKFIINDNVIYIKISEDIDDVGYFNAILLNANKESISPKFTINPFNSNMYDFDIDIFNNNDDNVSCMTSDTKSGNISINKEKTDKIKDAIMNSTSLDLNKIVNQAKSSSKPPPKQNLNDMISQAKQKKVKQSDKPKSYASIVKDKDEESAFNEVTTDTEGTADTEISIENIQEKTELAQNTFIKCVEKFIQNNNNYFDLKPEFKKIECFSLLKYTLDSVKFYENIRKNHKDSPLPKEHFFEWCQAYLRKNNPHLAVVFGEFSARGEESNKFLIYDIEKRESKSFPRLDRGRNENKDFLQYEKERVIEIICDYIYSFREDFDEFEPIECKDIPGLGAMFDIFYIPTCAKDIKYNILKNMKEMDYDISQKMYIDFGSFQKPLQYPETPKLNINKHYLNY
jgi:hypothetical protein